MKSSARLQRDTDARVTEADAFMVIHTGLGLTCWPGTHFRKQVHRSRQIILLRFVLLSWSSLYQNASSE